MPVLKPRTHVVYFRISEDEFIALNRLCAQQGARSLSDMARAAMQDLLRGSVGESGAQGMAGRLEAMERTLLEVNETLRSLSAHGNGAGKRKGTQQ